MQPLARNGFTEAEILDALRAKSGSRKLTFRYDLLDQDNKYLGRLDNVLECSISQSYLAEIKRTATFKILDDGQINYLSHRIQPWVELHMPGVPSHKPQTYEEILEGEDSLAVWYPADDAAGQTTVENRGPSGAACNGTANEPGILGHPGVVSGQGLRFQNAGYEVTPEFRASAFQTTDTTQMTFDLEIPEGCQPGDLAVVAVMSTSASGVHTPDPDWNYVANSPEDIGSRQCAVAWRILDGTESAYHGVSTVTQTWVGSIVVFKAGTFDPDDPIVAGNRQLRSSTTTQVVAPGLVVGNHKILLAIYLESSGVSGQFTPPNPLTTIAGGFSPGAAVEVSSHITAAMLANPGITPDLAATYDVASAIGYGVQLAVAPYVFTGSQYVAADCEDIAGTEALTMSAWVNPTTIGVNGVMVAVSDEYSGTPGALLRFADEGPLGGAANCLRAEVRLDDGTLVVAESQANVQRKDVSHFVATWESGVGIKLYMNGTPLELTGSQNSNATGTLRSSADTILLGADGTPGQFFDGYLDEVVVFRSALTEQTVNDLYRSALRIGPYSSDRIAAWPQGVFLLSSPRRVHDESGRVVREVEAYDTLQVLADDVVTDRFTATAGDKYTEVIDGLLGDIPANITPHPEDRTLTYSQEWEPGTSKLQIINDLLQQINYESLWIDENGVAVCQPYVSPTDRGAEFIYADDAESVTLPEVEQNLDLYSVPNKWTLVVSNPDLDEPLTATVLNDDPSSITSTVARGRTIVDFRTDVDAPDQAELNKLASRIAWEASQVYEEVSFSTALMPMHSHNDVYTFRFSGLSVSDKFAETEWNMTLVADATMEHRCRRVVNLNLE